MKPVILPYKDRHPKIADSAFIAPTAVIVGDVEIGEDVSIWYGCVLRGDVNHIRIGARSNIQDGTIVHVTHGGNPTLVGEDVLVGHQAVLHACTIESHGFVGMSATVLDGAIVESGGMVAAGALLTSNKRVETGQLWAGSPARHVRDISDNEKEWNKWAIPHYVQMGRDHAAAVRNAEAEDAERG